MSDSAEQTTVFKGVLKDELFSKFLERRLAFEPTFATDEWIRTFQRIQAKEEYERRDKLCDCLDVGPQKFLVVTLDPDNSPVVVSWQDEEYRMLEILWEKGKDLPA